MIYLKIMKNNEMTIKKNKKTTQDQATLNLPAWTSGPFGVLVDFNILLFLFKLLQSSGTRKPAIFLTETFCEMSRAFRQDLKVAMNYLKKISKA